MTTSLHSTILTDLEYIHKLVDQGGPLPHEYSELDQWLVDMHRKVMAGLYSEKEMVALRDAFGESLSTKTMHGRAFQKPYGYPGDFEVIDLTYLYHISPDPMLKKWDEYTHQRGFLRALRNRKTYFKDILSDLYQKQNKPLKILNIASGPCRDIAEFLEEQPDCPFEIDCLEFDPRAIVYAKKLLKGNPQVRFINQNIFKFDTDKKYDLVWSAGLFDYFDDATFLKILQNALSWTVPGGEVIVGNFTKSCMASVAHFELVDWPLNYRNEKQLHQLAENAGINASNRRIGAEPLGINLFLHLTKTEA